MVAEHRVRRLKHIQEKYIITEIRYLEKIFNRFLGFIRDNAKVEDGTNWIRELPINFEWTNQQGIVNIIFG